MNTTQANNLIKKINEQGLNLYFNNNEDYLEINDPSFQTLVANYLKHTDKLEKYITSKS